MLKKIEHIGIAVKDLKASNELFKKLLGVPHYKTEQVASEGVTTSFFDVGTIKLSCWKQRMPTVLLLNLLLKKGKACITLLLR